MRFEIYHSETRQDQTDSGWYWRLRARNGRVIADGSESYKSKAGIRRAIWRLNEAFIYAGRPIEIVEIDS